MILNVLTVLIVNNLNHIVKCYPYFYIVVNKYTIYLTNGYAFTGQTVLFHSILSQQVIIDDIRHLLLACILSFYQ